METDIPLPIPVRSRSLSAPAPPSSSPQKIVFALVGLPARGKSFISSKIATFFNWSGTPARIFNAGTKRRNVEGAKKSGHSSFFSTANKSAVSKRDEIALATLEDAIHWLTKDNGSVALFDATNTTEARRQLIRERLDQESVPINLIFIESICTDETVLRNNLLQKIRHSPDFDGIPEEEALQDLRARIASYEQVYEPVSDDENAAYIKVINFHSKVICYLIFGAIPLRCVQLLMSSHVGSRPVYLVRSGHCDDVDDMNKKVNAKSELWLEMKTKTSGPPGYKVPETTTPNKKNNASALDGKVESIEHLEFSSPPPARITIPSALTCNSHLSEKGHRFGRRLRQFLLQQESIILNGGRAIPFTSNTRRALETAAYLPQPPAQHQQWSALNILDTGICHGLSVETIREEMKSEFALWKKDPFLYRFPGGESMLDMNRRLCDVVLEIERLQEPAVIVSHLSTIQSLIAYFTSLDTRETPFVSVPQHAIIMLTPNIYGITDTDGQWKSLERINFPMYLRGGISPLD